MAMSAAPSTEIEIRVMALDNLHVVVGDRSLCGRVKLAADDCLSDEVALRAWNAALAVRCVRCVAALRRRAGR